MKALQEKLAISQVAELVQGAVVVDGFRVVAAIVENTERDGLRHLVDELKNRIGSGVVVLASAIGNEAAFIAGVTADLVKNPGLQAGKILQEVTRIADGRGGGRPDLAQGGSKEPGKMKSAIDAVVSIVAQSSRR